MNKSTGALLATVVAGLVLTGTGLAKAQETAPAKVKCEGINSCKGSGMCKSAANACKGQNGCQGKGWIEVGSEKECTDKGGKVVSH